MWRADGRQRLPVPALPFRFPTKLGVLRHTDAQRIYTDGFFTDSFFTGYTMSSVRRRKNLFIDQRRIDRVKALLHVDTETEAIDRALAMVEDLALFEAEVDRGLTGLSGKGGFVDRFPVKASRR